MKHRSFKTLFVIGLTTLISFSTPSLEAVLVSIKAAGMGLTGVAYPQDALAGAFNPAGITEVGDRFDFGLSLDHFEGHAKISGSAIPTVNGTFNGTHYKNQVSPDFGINKSFCFCDDWEIAVGFVAYNRDYAKTTYDEAFPILGTSHLKLEFIREEFSPMIAVRFLECHSVGISLNCFAQRAKVNGIENFDNATASLHPGHVTNNGYDWAGGVGVTIGYLGQFTDWLAVGVAYSPEGYMSKFKKYSGFLAQEGKLNAPARIAGGIALTFIPCTTITFDVEHLQYKNVRALHNPLLPNLLTAQLGSENGVGFGWRNQTIFRVGADYQLCDDWTIRAGYRYGRTPIRSSQAAVNILLLETVEQYATCGVTWSFCDFAELSAFYAHGFEKTVDGDGAIPAGRLGGGNVDLTLHREVVGISYGQCF